MQIKWVLILSLLLSCGHKAKETSPDDDLKMKTTEVVLPPSFKKAQDLLLKMTPEEKRKILMSYVSLREISTGNVDPTLSISKFFAGIPRLGIPSIQLITEDTISSSAAAPLRTEGEVLKLGSVNLVTNSEKEQVYQNFAQADRVDRVLSPNKGPIPEAPDKEEHDLQDLDIFLVNSGSKEEGIKNHVCAIHRKKENEYKCVESTFAETKAELGLEGSLSSALKKNQLTESQIDSIVFKMLAAMYELNIIS